MSYLYSEQRGKLFTDEGQRMFLVIRDNVAELLKKSEAVMLGVAIRPGEGDTWLKLACIDRMIELGELRELPTRGTAQERVLIRGTLR